MKSDDDEECKEDCERIWRKAYFENKYYKEQQNKKAKYNHSEDDQGWQDWSPRPYSEWEEQRLCDELMFGSKAQGSTWDGSSANWATWDGYGSTCGGAAWEDHSTQNVNEQKTMDAPGQDAVPSPEYDPFAQGPDVLPPPDAQQQDGTDGGPAQAVAPQQAQPPPGCEPLSWQKSGWMARCILLMALWKKGHFDKMQEYMWKFSEHHSVRMHALCLESHLQKFGPEVGPWKLGYNF